MNPVETFSFKGFWWDELWKRNPHTGTEYLAERTPLRSNLVVNNGRILLAALLKNDPTIGVGKGVLYHAIGVGDSAWDTGGTPTPGPTQDTLTAEIASGGRVAPDEIVFLDGTGTPTLTPTARIRVKTTFDYGDLEPTGVDIREQGLFGGDADGNIDTGYMIDVINHGRIFKDSNVRLTRYIEFQF